jgi:hypothetical protein
LIPCAKPDLTLPQQFLLLGKNPNCNGHGQLSATRLVWNYATRPTPLNREYQIRIVLENGGTPDVTVVQPDIETLAGGRTLPHVYHNPLRLCLYMPGSDEWNGRMRLDQKIVPWVAIWLFYFEEWLSSNEWQGGGQHPAEVLEHSNRRTRRMSQGLGGDLRAGT